MNVVLEKQVQEYLGKSVSELPPDIAALLAAVNTYYDNCDDKMVICEREKIEMAGALERDREEILRREAHLAASQRIAKVGSWELDLTNLDNLNANPLYWSDETFRIMGFIPGSVEASNELFFTRVHPADIAPIMMATTEAVKAGKPYDIEHRLVLPGGVEKVVHERADVVCDDAGRPVKMIGTLQDMTARKAAEKKIAESELLNRTFFEQNLAGVYRTTPAGNILTCNEAFAAMLGYNSPQELLKVNAASLYFTPTERESYIADLRQHGKPRNYSLKLKHSDGSALYIIENITLVKDPVTGEEYCDGIMVNITGHKKAEEEFYKQEERYRQIVETAQEGIWTIDEDNKTNFVNKKICEILGYSPDEMMGKELYDFMDDEGREYAIACMERRRKGAKENLDIRYVTKSGKDVWTNISANPIFDADGCYKGSLAMITDITERKYQEELLKKSEANLRTIFDHTDASFILLDEHLRLVSFNAVAQTVMRGQSETSLVEGGFLMDYFSDERRPIIQNVVNKVLAGETVAYEAALKQFDGSSRWYDVKWAGITNDDNKICGIILTSSDITDKKTVMLEHERMTAELVQRNKDLQQFNYIVSHNLRAPVANILGLSALLSSHQDDALHKEQLLAGLSLSTKNLDEIIKDLNYILQVREEGVHEKKENVNLLQLVEDIKLSISNIIVKEKVVLNCEFEQFDTLLTIRSYLYSIFYNLILNSIKYRQQGIDPVINIRSTRQKNTAELLFEDNGKGIDIKRNGKDLFGLYKRFDNIVEGKGIGLFMVKTQVENLNGKISVQSKLNKGTTFKLELPL